MKNTDKRNMVTFGLGTIGRDMIYTLVSMFLVVYLTEVLNIPDRTLWWVNLIFTLGRVYDAVNDPAMGFIVDNTRTRFGKFKPWVAIGAFFTCFAAVFMFTDFGLTGTKYIISFTILYLFWEVAFSANDIAYWSMLPALSIDQKQREKIGAFAKICANIGLFAVVVGIVPITKALATVTGDEKTAYTLFATILAILMLGGQCITLFGVKEHKEVFKEEEKTGLREMFRVIFKNDQLLYTAISMSLFMIGYVTTTSFGFYFFKYSYRNEDMYSIFALILGVTQIIALAIFPLFSKKYNRRTLYAAATALVVAGYVIFFLAPMDMAVIGPAGILIFLGEAFIQLLMLMFLADCVEYGQWKLGKRNESITFAIQPFINKLGAALANGIVMSTLIISGINEALTPDDVTPQGLLIMKIAMMIIPLILILAGYIVYKYKFRIDENLYKQIVADLKERGDINL